MEKIESLEQYKEAVSGFRRRGYILSNCFFLPEAIRQKTAEGTLFVRQINGGALILDDQGRFYRCYYFFLEEGEPEKIEIDKDTVIEFPYKEEMNEKQIAQIKMIEKLGFGLGRKSSMMTANPEQIVYNTEDEGTVSYATMEDIFQIKELLNSSFNPLYAFLPEEDELLWLIKDSRVFVIRDNKTISAALISDCSKRIAAIRQIAVDEHKRGSGLGKRLLNAYHRNYTKQVLRFQHWVDLENKPAIHMYIKHGYQFDTRKAYEYVLTEK